MGQDDPAQRNVDERGQQPGRLGQEEHLQDAGRRAAPHQAQQVHARGPTQAQVCNRRVCACKQAITVCCLPKILCQPPASESQQVYALGRCPAPGMQRQCR